MDEQGEGFVSARIIHCLCDGNQIPVKYTGVLSTKSNIINVEKPADTRIELKSIFRIVGFIKKTTDDYSDFIKFVCGVIIGSLD